MTTITAVVLAKMRTVTAAKDNNYGSIGGVKIDLGLFYADRFIPDVLGSAFLDCVFCSFCSFSVILLCYALSLDYRNIHCVSNMLRKLLQEFVILRTTITFILSLFLREESS